jgi:homoserine O-acetyltransferase/O-succinyltransferase
MMRVDPMCSSAIKNSSKISSWTAKFWTAKWLIKVKFCLAAGPLAALLAGTASGQGEAAGQNGQLQIAELGQCKLESGQVIEDCRVGYRTFGHLNAAGDNAVLMPTWLYETSGELVSLFGDGSSPQQLVDTSKFFGIAIDALGNGVSSSPSNSPHQHGTTFPAYTLRDGVATQYRVMTEVLHLKHLHALVGLSMGGEQTFVWSAMYPKFFDLAVPILGTPRMTSYDLHVKQIMVESITGDPAYKNGQYTQEPALKLANLFGALVVTSPEFRNRATPRDKLVAFLAATEAPQPIDANDRVWQLRAIMKQDVIGNRSLDEAAKAAPAHFLVIVSAEDHLVNPQPALDWAAATGAPTYVSHGDCAHLIMTCDAPAVSSRVRRFLETGRLP